MLEYLLTIVFCPALVGIIWQMFLDKKEIKIVSFNIKIIHQQ